jgi:hypothetical protein
MARRLALATCRRRFALGAVESSRARDVCGAGDVEGRHDRAGDRGDGGGGVQGDIVACVQGRGARAAEMGDASDKDGVHRCSIRAPVAARQRVRLVTYAFLLRFMMQWLRAPFRNPLGQAVVALTDWACKPAAKVFRLQGARRFHAGARVGRRIAPGLRRWRSSSSSGFDGGVAATFALLAVSSSSRRRSWILIHRIIAQALLSWFAPTARSPVC